MPVLDVQLHVWERSRPDRSWPSGASVGVHLCEEMHESTLVDMMDSAGVDRALLVPPSFEGDRNDLVARAVAQYPARFRALARVGMEALVAAPREVVAKLSDRTDFLGIRLTVHGSTEGCLDGDALEGFWKAAEASGTRIAIYAPSRLEKLQSILARHPGLNLCLDHLALPLDARNATARRHLERVIALFADTNATVKATALPFHFDEEFPFPAAGSMLARAVEGFGAERVFWGSDATRLAVPYSKVVLAARTAVSQLSVVDQELVLGEAAARWWGWSDETVSARELDAKSERGGQSAGRA